MNDLEPLICRVCQRGTLVNKKVYRMSTPVVAIGFIFLIPSVLGILFSAIMFLGIFGGRGEGGTGEVAMIQSGGALVLGIGAFVGGLIGWLLVMKKRVLQC